MCQNLCPKKHYEISEIDRTGSDWVCKRRPADLAAGEVTPSATERGLEEAWKEKGRTRRPAPLHVAWCTRACVRVDPARVRTLRPSAHPAHSVRIYPARPARVLAAARRARLT